MKRFRVMAAALCAVVLLCGFSVPAYAYADGGEGADYGDPTMTEETPAPEPTIEPGEGFSEEGNLVTRDLLYDEHTNKQFITVQTSGGNTFYIVIDYDKPVDEEGEQYETYFFSVVDEADLLAAAEAAGVEQAVCSCSEKCEAGAVNTDCAVCSVNMSKCVGVEPEPTETEEPAPEEAEPETGGNTGMLLAVLAVALVGGGAAFYFKVLRPKQQKAAAPQEDYFNRPVHMDLYFTRQQVMGEAFQAWGAIIYAHPLTEREMQNYELRPSRENLDIRRQMDAQAQVVGKWEDAHHVPDQKRLTWFYPDFGSYVVKEYITPEQLTVRVRSIERQEAARAHKEAKHQPPIAEQLKAAQREAQEQRAPDAPKKKAPDRGDR